MLLLGLRPFRVTKGRKIKKEHSGDKENCSIIKCSSVLRRTRKSKPGQPCQTYVSSYSRFRVSVLIHPRQGHSNFSVTEAVEGQCPPDLDPKVQSYREWGGDKGRCLLSTEGIPLVVHVPQLLKGDALVSLSTFLYPWDHILTFKHISECGELRRHELRQ